MVTNARRILTVVNQYHRLGSFIEREVIREAETPRDAEERAKFYKL